MKDTPVTDPRIFGLATEEDAAFFRDRLAFNVRCKGNRGRFERWFRAMANSGSPVCGDSLTEALGYQNSDNVAASDDLLRSLTAAGIIRPLKVEHSLSTAAFLTLERRRSVGARYAREFSYEFCADRPEAREFALSLGMAEDEIAPPFSGISKNCKASAVCS